MNTWKIKVWLSQKWKELSKWNKKHFSLFHKCSLLDIQSKQAKCSRHNFWCYLFYYNLARDTIFTLFGASNSLIFIGYCIAEKFDADKL